MLGNRWAVLVAGRNVRWIGTAFQAAQLGPDAFAGRVAADRTLGGGVDFDEHGVIDCCAECVFDRREISLVAIGRKNDTHFYVGNMHQHSDNWLIVGLFYPPKVATADLLDTPIIGPTVSRQPS